MIPICIASQLPMEKNKVFLLLDIDDTLFNTAKFKESNFKTFEIYEDVRDALEELAEICMLGILSQGTLDLQKKKLLETQIHHYFHEQHTHIVALKVAAFKEILTKYHGLGKVIFVEDRLETLSRAKKTDPSIVAIWMKRGRYAATQKPIPGFSPDFTIRSLSELLSIVKEA